MKLPEFKDVEAAAQRLDGHHVRTPLLRSVELDRHCKGEVFVKPECLQLSGAFKFRGAWSRLSALSDAERARGIVTFSSGNHGQAVALAAHMLGLQATVVMPANAPAIKKRRTQSHGAEVITYDPEQESREAIAGKLAEERGAVLVPSYDDFHVIAGQGTAGLEVCRDMTARGDVLDSYLVCTGGGGLLAGTVLAFRELSPATKIYSVEPVGRDDHARSFAAGKRQPHKEKPRPTICDALLPREPGVLTFAINEKHVTGGLTVSDDEVRDAMGFAADYLNLVVEPSGAAALAAVLSGKVETAGKRTGLIITGGNVDRDQYLSFLKEAKT